MGWSISPRANRLRAFGRLCAWTLAFTVLIAGILAYAVRDHVRTLQSLQRIPDTRLYVLDYYANDNFHEIRSRGMDVSDIEGSVLRTLFPDFLLPVVQFARQRFLGDEVVVTRAAATERCTTATTRDSNGQVLFGRNFDWKNDACLLVRHHHRDVARSVAMIDLHYLRLGGENLEQLPLWKRLPLLLAPYYVMDGMNEHGLAVADMAVGNTSPPHDAMKPDLVHSTAMRLLLNDAHSVDTALEILDKYNIHFVETTCHLMLADRSGASAVVEFIDGEVCVTRGAETGQVCTNHLLHAGAEDAHRAQCSRYRTVADALVQGRPFTGKDELRQVMAKAANGDRTMWTSLYNLSTGDVEICYRSQWTNGFVDRLRPTLHAPSGAAPSVDDAGEAPVEETEAPATAGARVEEAIATATF